MFDVNTLLAGLLATLQTSLGALYTGSVIPIAEDFFRKKKIRISDLVKSRLANEEGITNEFFYARVKDEAAILKNELLAIATIAEADLETAANNVADFLKNTVLNLLPKLQQ